MKSIIEPGEDYIEEILSFVTDIQHPKTGINRIIDILTRNMNQFVEPEARRKVEDTLRKLNNLTCQPDKREPDRRFQALTQKSRVMIGYGAEHDLVNIIENPDKKDDIHSTTETILGVCTLDPTSMEQYIADQIASCEDQHSLTAWVEVQRDFKTVYTIEL